MSQPILDLPDTDIDRDFVSIIKNEEKVEDDDSGDHDRFSHYVSKEDIVRSSMSGQPVFAICGKKWTPSKNPSNYPVCQTCKGVYDQIRDE